MIEELVQFLDDEIPEYGGTTKKKLQAIRETLISHQQMAKECKELMDEIRNHLHTPQDISRIRDMAKRLKLL